MAAQPAPRITPAPTGVPPYGRLRDALDRRADWIEALIVLTTVAAAFVVLGFLASYFKDYFRIGHGHGHGVCSAMEQRSAINASIQSARRSSARGAGRTAGPQLVRGLSSAQAARPISPLPHAEPPKRRCSSGLARTLHLDDGLGSVGSRSSARRLELGPLLRLGHRLDGRAGGLRSIGHIGPRADWQSIRGRRPTEPTVLASASVAPPDSVKASTGQEAERDRGQAAGPNQPTNATVWSARRPTIDIATGAIRMTVRIAWIGRTSLDITDQRADEVGRRPTRRRSTR